MKLLRAHRYMRDAGLISFMRWAMPEDQGITGSFTRLMYSQHVQDKLVVVCESRFVHLCAFLSHIANFCDRQLLSARTNMVHV